MAKYLGKTDTGHKIESDSGDVYHIPDAVAQNNPDFMNMIDNPPVDPSQTDARFSSVDPTLKDQDFRTSEQKRKQELYNNHVATSNMIATPDGGFASDQATKSMFGPKGEHPEDFDANAYEQAEKTYSQEQDKKAAADQQKSADIDKNNEIRQRAGLAPIDNPYKEDTTQAPDEATPQAAPTPEAAAQPNPTNQQIAQQHEDNHVKASTVNAGHIEKMAQEDAANHTKVMNDTSDEIFKQSAIDPDRWSKSHNQVSTAIGLILGGLSQGLMRTKSNAVADYISHAIDQDVEAQKNDKTNNVNTYKLFLEKTKNEKEAELATKTLLQKQTRDAWEKEASKRGLDQAAAMIPTNLASKEAQTMKDLSEVTQNRFKTNLMNQAGQGGDKYFTGDIANSMSRQVPLVDSNGNITKNKAYTIDPEGAKSLRANTAVTGTIVNNINQLLKFADKPSRLWSPTDRATISRLQDSLNQMQPDFFPHSRLTEYEQKQIKDMSGNLNSTDLFGQTKTNLKTIKNIILNKMGQEYKANGIDQGISSPEDKINALGGSKR